MAGGLAAVCKRLAARGYWCQMALGHAGREVSVGWRECGGVGEGRGVSLLDVLCMAVMLLLGIDATVLACRR